MIFDYEYILSRNFRMSNDGWEYQWLWINPLPSTCSNSTNFFFFCLLPLSGFMFPPHSHPSPPPLPLALASAPTPCLATSSWQPLPVLIWTLTFVSDSCPCMFTMACVGDQNLPETIKPHKSSTHTRDCTPFLSLHVYYG